MFGVFGNLGKEVLERNHAEEEDPVIGDVVYMTPEIIEHVRAQNDKFLAEKRNSD